MKLGKHACPNSEANHWKRNETYLSLMVTTVANKMRIGVRSIIQLCKRVSFAVGVLPYDKAIEQIPKFPSKKLMAPKVKTSLRKNFEAVDKTLETLSKIDVS